MEEAQSQFSIANSINAELAVGQTALLVKSPIEIETGQSGIVRSKTAFCFRGIDASTPLLSSLSPGASLPAENSTPKTAENSPPKTALNEEKQFKDLDQQGFLGIWSHPMTRAYFLLFLLTKDLGKWFFFKMDVLEFRKDSRKALAKRIYHTYLGKYALLQLFPEVYTTNQTGFIAKALDQISVELDDQLAYSCNTLFDEIALRATQILENAYSGNPNDMNEIQKLHFRESAAYQMLKTDLGGKWKPSCEQFAKTVDRLLDVPQSFFGQNDDLFSRFEDYISSLGGQVDSSRIKSRLSSINRSKTPTGYSARNTSASVELKGDESPRKSPGNTLIQESMQAAEHAFIRINQQTNVKWCEHCFEVARDSEALALYQCQGCGYVAHKSCRNQTLIACNKARNHQEEDVQVADASQIQQKIQDLQTRLDSIKKEITIETRIMEGLLKMDQAKQKDKKSKRTNLQELDLTSVQIEKCKKKLDILMIEKGKCTNQIDTYNQDLQNAIQKKDQVPEINLENEKMAKILYENSEIYVPVADIYIVRDLLVKTLAKIQKDPSDQFVIARNGQELIPEDKLDFDEQFELCNEPVQESQQSLDLYANDDPKMSSIEALGSSGRRDTFVTVKESIDFQAQNSVEEFVLQVISHSEQAILESLYPEPSHESAQQVHSPVITTPNEVTTKEVADVFKFTLKKLPRITVADTEEMAKQVQVVQEIIDSERQYLFYLGQIEEIMHYLVAGSLQTFDQIRQVFSNIESIKLIHECIVENFEQPSTCQVLEAYLSQVENMQCYTVYCGNQNHATRVLSQWREQPELQKELAKLEANPKLNKLTLADLLVKPMHRITRAPLLLKRLQSHCPLDSREYSLVTLLISKTLQIITEINEIVRKKESAFRLEELDATFDFGGIVEKFSLKTAERELLSEKTFSFIRKSGTQAPLELVVFVFNDMVLLTKVKKQNQFVLWKPPLPFESCVLLDQEDLPEFKNVFQLVHLENEVYNLQSRSKFDKMQWLQQTENARFAFCAAFHAFESSLLANRFLRGSNSLVRIKTGTSSDKVSRQSTFVRKSDDERRKTLSPKKSIRRQDGLPEDAIQESGTVIESSEQSTSFGELDAPKPQDNRQSRKGIMSVLGISGWLNRKKSVKSTDPRSKHLSMGPGDLERSRRTSKEPGNLGNYSFEANMQSDIDLYLSHSDLNKH